ncbi:MAG: DUF1801 domain-containing protein [Chryseolinea sp.]
MATPVTIDDMLSTLPKQERVMVDRLRSLVIECLPKATEKEFYGLGIPFYRHHRLICYIWPSSVLWETDKPDPAKKGVVTLGFCQGYMMSNDEGFLLAEGRKQVYVMYFRKLSEIDDNIIRGLLYEAGLIDDAFGAAKRKSKTAKRKKS